MSMKGKPNTDQFKPTQKDPSAFLESGAADRAEKSTSKVTIAESQPVEPKKPEPTVQKLFRLRWDTANALRLGVAQQSAIGGKRVTETEIVESLLRGHYGIDR